MKLRRQQLARVALGLVLIVLAAFVASVVRNALAQRDPQNSLPTMHVSFTTSEGTTMLPDNVVRLDTYDWRFMFWQRSGGGKDLAVWQEIAPSWVSANAAINIRFSFEPKSYRLFIQAEQSEFVEYTGHELVIPAPEEATNYTLRVEANWGNGKDATYYAKVKVDAW